MHIFDLYRRGVMVVITVYALVRTVRGLGLLLARMSEPSRQSRMMRGYLAAMLLSIRIRRFWPELLQIALLLILLAAVAYAHVFVLDRI